MSPKTPGVSRAALLTRWKVRPLRGEPRLRNPDVVERHESGVDRGVAGTGTPFYTRGVPGGLERVPGLADQLAAGCRFVDTACGTGVGVVRLATHYPQCQIVGIDGDPHSIERARERVTAAGIRDRVRLTCNPLVEFTLDEPARVVVNNISMHECRDIDAVAQHVRAALEPDGWFVISDFPFPDPDDALCTPPGRITCGIQFFESQIDDQLTARRLRRPAEPVRPHRPRVDRADADAPHHLGPRLTGSAH